MINYGHQQEHNQSNNVEFIEQINSDLEQFIAIPWRCFRVESCSTFSPDQCMACKMKLLVSIHVTESDKKFFSIN